MQSIASNTYYETIYPGVTLGAVIMPRGTLMIDAPLRAACNVSVLHAPF